MLVQVQCVRCAAVSCPLPVPTHHQRAAPSLHSAHARAPAQRSTLARWRARGRVLAHSSTRTAAVTLTPDFRHPPHDGAVCGCTKCSLFCVCFIILNFRGGSLQYNAVSTPHSCNDCNQKMLLVIANFNNKNCS